jgi:hypothetical protein
LFVAALKKNAHTANNIGLIADFTESTYCIQKVVVVGFVAEILVIVLLYYKFQSHNFKLNSQTSIFLVVVVDNKTHFHYERYGTTTIIHISNGFVYNLWGYIFFLT